VARARTGVAICTSSGRDNRPGGLPNSFHQLAQALPFASLGSLGVGGALISGLPLLHDRLGDPAILLALRIAGAEWKKTGARPDHHRQGDDIRQPR